MSSSIAHLCLPFMSYFDILSVDGNMLLFELLEEFPNIEDLVFSSAVLHNNALWVFGGMTDLQERSDFWRFDFG